MSSDEDVITFSRALELVDSGHPFCIRIPKVSILKWNAFIKECQDRYGSENHLRISYDSTLSLVTLKIPTGIHESVNSWLGVTVNEFLYELGLRPAEGARYLHIISNKRYENFTGSGSPSSKEPDFAVEPVNASFASLILETAYTERSTSIDLQEDLRLWKSHTRRKSKVVIGFNIVKRIDGISCTAYLWRRCTNSTEQIQIFPEGTRTGTSTRPASGGTTGPYITAEELFGDPPYPPGVVGNEKLYFDLGLCREMMKVAIEKDNEAVAFQEDTR